MYYCIRTGNIPDSSLFRASTKSLGLGLDLEIKRLAWSWLKTLGLSLGLDKKWKSWCLGLDKKSLNYISAIHLSKLQMFLFHANYCLEYMQHQQSELWIKSSWGLPNYTGWAVMCTILWALNDIINSIRLVKVYHCCVVLKQLYWNTCLIPQHWVITTIWNWLCDCDGKTEEGTSKMPFKDEQWCG